MPETTRREITEVEARRDFILAGNSRFTLVSTRTGARFTYHAKRWEKHEKVRYYISVLTGPSNTDDYRKLGVLYPNGRLYRQDRHPNAISASAGSWRALDYLFNQGGIQDPRVEVWHEGRCGRSGRHLTVPESIASGIGPVCAERMDG
jgi:hypothetical protein